MNVVITHLWMKLVVEKTILEMTIDGAVLMEI